jgi:hypothetical protein
MWHEAWAQPSQSGADWLHLIWPTDQMLELFQFPLCQRVMEGRCMGFPMPKVGGGRVRWPTGHVYGWPDRVW